MKWNKMYRWQNDLSSLLLFIGDCWVEWILWSYGRVIDSRVDWTHTVIHSWVFAGRSGFDDQFITTSFFWAVFKGDGRVMQRGRGICWTVGSGINRVHCISRVWILDGLLYLCVDIILQGRMEKQYSLNKSLLTFNTLTTKFCPVF